MPEEHLFQDGTLSFLPTRLNRQPVVIGGLTADEMWITVSPAEQPGSFLASRLPWSQVTLPAFHWARCWSAPSAWVSAAASCGG